MLSLDQMSWLLNEIDEKVIRIRSLSDTNYVGDNAAALLEILDEVIRDLETK